MALNEKFIKARRDYESLLETSMSQSASHYGRPGQAPYNYGGDPYQPAGGEPSRYYTPAPQMNPSASPSLQHGAFSPPPQQSGLPYSPGGGRRTSNNFYSPADNHDVGPPPHGNNAPFYVIGQAPPGTQLPGGQGVKSSQQSNHLPSNPSGHSADGQTQPQELATSVYDSPLDGRPPQGSAFNPNPSTPGQEMIPSPSQPPGQSPYSAYQGYQPQQRPLSTGPVYTESPAGSGPHPYPVLQSASPSGAGGTAHQAYAPPNGGGRPPQNYYTQQHEPPAPTHSAPPPPQQGSAPPHEYYTGRPNELFLPPGSRAQS